MADGVSRVERVAPRARWCRSAVAHHGPLGLHAGSDHPALVVTDGFARSDRHPPSRWWSAARASSAARVVLVPVGPAAGAGGRVCRDQGRGVVLHGIPGRKFKGFVSVDRGPSGRRASLAAGAEHALAARFSIPPQFAPQLVMAWLPLSDLASALRLSSAWYEASEPAFEMVSRRPGHNHDGARAFHNENLMKLIEAGCGAGPRLPTTTGYGVGDVVWLEPLKDGGCIKDIPEARFRITDVFDDCVGGYSLEGPLVGEYGEPPKDTITAVAGVPWRAIVQISLLLRKREQRRVKRIALAGAVGADENVEAGLEAERACRAEGAQVLDAQLGDVVLWVAHVCGS